MTAHLSFEQIQSLCASGCKLSMSTQPKGRGEKQQREAVASKGPQEKEEEVEPSQHTKIMEMLDDFEAWMEENSPEDWVHDTNPQPPPTEEEIEKWLGKY